MGVGRWGSATGEEPGGEDDEHGGGKPNEMAVDEAHLLNISVAALHQHQGLGRMLLDQATGVARQHHMRTMLLEVRESNVHAAKVYRQYGFTEIGRRKNYYPAANQTREGAIVMSLPL